MRPRWRITPNGVEIELSISEIFRQSQVPVKRYDVKVVDNDRIIITAEIDEEKILREAGV